MLEQLVGQLLVPELQCVVKILHLSILADLVTEFWRWRNSLNRFHYSFYKGIDLNAIFCNSHPFT